MRLFVLSLVIILSRISFFQVKGVCKKLVFQPSLTSKLLQNHVILSVSVTKESDCEVQCYLDNRCLSYNYIQSTKICQLSDSDAHIDSKDLVTDVYSIYRGTKNACQGVNCWYGKKCKPDLLTNRRKCNCPKGFAGTKCKNAIGEGCTNYKYIWYNSFQSHKNVFCNSSVQAKWYRFFPGKILQKCSAQYCENKGWFVGSIPAKTEYIVNRQVCFVSKTSCCASSTDILFRNCGSFFVYYLKPLQDCKLEYCMTRY